MDGNDAHGNPVLVQYESGEVHHCSLESANQLTIVQPDPRMLSVVQGFVLTPLMALYPLITKICLRFLHCERCLLRTQLRTDACSSSAVPSLTHPNVSLAITRTHTRAPASPQYNHARTHALACARAQVPLW